MRIIFYGSYIKASRSLLCIIGELLMGGCVICLINRLTVTPHIYEQVEDSFYRMREKYTSSILEIAPCNTMIWGVKNDEIARRTKVTVICDAAIYNKYDIATGYGIIDLPANELIARLYELTRDIYHVVNVLKGEFAFILHDAVTKTLYAVRDPLGVRPLFIGCDSLNRIAFASELKALSPFMPYVTQMPGGAIAEVNTDTLHIQMHTAHTMSILRARAPNCTTFAENIANAFEVAVRRRLSIDCDIARVCAVHTGDVYSHIMCACASRVLKDMGAPEPLRTFGTSAESDTHTHIYEVPPSGRSYAETLSSTIDIIESYDLETVRSGVYHYIIANHIALNTNFNVVLTADYGRELTQIVFDSDNDSDFCRISSDRQCQRQMTNAMYLSSLKTDRTMASQGLEARMPFADVDFVDAWLSAPIVLRSTPNLHLLFSVFGQPERWRPLNKAEQKEPEEDFDFGMYTYNTPKTKEALQYRNIFEGFYPGHGRVFPRQS